MSLGAFALGDGAVGFGVPETAPAPVVGAFVDQDGSVQGSPYIDPNTRRPVYDAFGRVLGCPNGLHLILQALTTVLDSSQIAGFGCAALDGVLTEDYAARRADAVRVALAPAIAAGAIELVSVTVDVTQTPIATAIVWRDPATGDTFSRAFA